MGRGIVNHILILHFVLLDFSDSFSSQSQPNSNEFIITDSVQCYSCMSKFYEDLWDKLQHTYSRPKNFTHLCDKERSQKDVGLVTCPSICIKMWEETIIGGYPVRGFIRGCYDNMLRRGFNQTLVRWYRWLQRDSCHYYNRKDILQLPYNVPGHINICTCYADGCNGAPRLSGARPRGTLTYSVWLLHYWPSLLAIFNLYYSWWVSPSWYPKYPSSPSSDHQNSDYQRPTTDKKFGARPTATATATAQRDKQQPTETDQKSKLSFDSRFVTNHGGAEIQIAAKNSDAHALPPLPTPIISSSCYASSSDCISFSVLSSS